MTERLGAHNPDDEFYITSASMLRNLDKFGSSPFSEQMRLQHQARLAHAQDFFDRWGINMDQLMSMPQDQYRTLVDRVVGNNVPLETGGNIYDSNNVKQ